MNSRDELEQLDRLRIAAEADDTQAMMTLAELHEGQERRAWLHRAYDQGERRASLLLGDEYTRDGQLEQAVQWYQHALEAGLSSAGPGLLDMLVGFGRLEDAELVARHVATSDPANPYAQDLLADVLERRGKTEEATLLRRQAEELAEPAATALGPGIAELVGVRALKDLDMDALVDNATRWRARRPISISWDEPSKTWTANLMR